MPLRAPRLVALVSCAALSLHASRSHAQSPPPSPSPDAPPAALLLFLGPQASPGSGPPSSPTPPTDATPAHPGSRLVYSGTIATVLVTGATCGFAVLLFSSQPALGALTCLPVVGPVSVAVFLLPNSTFVGSGASFALPFFAMGALELGATLVLVEGIRRNAEYGSFVRRRERVAWRLLPGSADTAVGLSVVGLF